MNKKYLAFTLASFLFCIANAAQDDHRDLAVDNDPIQANSRVDAQDAIQVNSRVGVQQDGHRRCNEVLNNKNLALQASGIAFATYAANNLAKDLGYEKAMLVTDFAHKSALTNALARGINLSGTKQSFIKCKCKGNLGDQVKSLGSAAAIESLAHLFTQAKYGKYLNKKYDEFFEYYNIKTIGNLGKQGAKVLATIQVARLFDKVKSGYDITFSNHTY